MTERYTNQGRLVDSKGSRRIHRQFDRIQRKVPFSARLLEWLRRPGARLIRVPLGILLVLGGVFSFLPVLGIWMLPLGLLLLALDVALLRAPVSFAIVRGGRKWTTWRRSRRGTSRGDGFVRCRKDMVCGIMIPQP